MRVFFTIVYIQFNNLQSYIFPLGIDLASQDSKVSNQYLRLQPFYGRIDKYPSFFILTWKQNSIVSIIIFYIPSMSSSPFQKDSSTMQGFDFNPQLGESSFNFIQALDEFDLEQSCLLRLKAQRQKIEELTQLYQENQKELLSRAEKEKQMKEEIERLSELTSVKEDWQDLKHEYEGLAKRYEMAEDQLMCVKKELEALTVSSGNQSEQLKQEIKYLKEQRLLSDAHWESILADKEEELKKQSRSSQQKEYELCQKIQQLQERVQTLEETLSERNSEIQYKKSEFQVELQVRQEDLCGFQKVVESFKKQNNEYKAKLVALQDSFEKEKEEYLQAIDQLKNQVRILKKDQTEKENELYQFKQIVKKCDTKNQALESTVTTLKTNLKKFKVNTDSNLKKVTSSNQEQKGRLQNMIAELKCELERQLQEKGSLAAEIKRLRGHIERKEQQEKQRKLLLMSQFRQIDKMEKIVKKII